MIKANKNRHNVPWIIVVGHRPMYSSDLSTDSGPLQQYLEPLLYQYQVDIARLLLVSFFDHRIHLADVFPNLKCGDTCTSMREHTPSGTTP